MSQEQVEITDKEYRRLGARRHDPHFYSKPVPGWHYRAPIIAHWAVFVAVGTAGFLMVLLLPVDAVLVYLGLMAALGILSSSWWWAQAARAGIAAVLCRVARKRQGLVCTSTRPCDVCAEVNKWATTPTAGPGPMPDGVHWV
jgi:hypothetical protein